MNWRGHFIGGLVAGIILFLLGFLPLTILSVTYSLAIIFIYSLLPDADVASSKIFRILLTISLAVILTGYYTKNPWFVLIPIAAILFFLVVKHRGITHSLLFAVIISLPLLLLSWQLFTLGLVSYISHLILDREIKLF